MYKAAARKHSHHSRQNQNNYDLYADLERIKSAFADTANDVRSKTSDMLSQSAENFREKSFQVRDNVANFTAEKPFKTLGITLLVGIAIGYFLHR